MAVSLTEKAEFRLWEFLRGSGSHNNDPKKGIRVSVKNGGCSGYEYSLDVTSKPKPDDIVIQQGNVLIYVDAESSPLLDGVVIDFVEGVMESGFKFTNPNATDTCGCGKSFKSGDCSPTGTPCK